MQHKEIKEVTVVMNDIASGAFLINADYFTGLLTYHKFIEVKEEINLEVLKLLEELKIEVAGTSTGIRIENAISGK